MRIKLQHILITACLLTTAFVNNALAQDAGMSDVEIPEADRDRMLYSPGGEGEVRSKAPAAVSTPVRDSVATVPATQKPTPPSAISTRKSDSTAKPAEKQAPPKEDTDSILTFNFLYYIIQKYKLQDIVD